MNTSTSAGRGNTIALIDKAKFLVVISDASKQSYMGVAINDPVSEFAIETGLKKLEERTYYKLRRSDIVITPIRPMPIETDDPDRLIDIWAEDLVNESEDASIELNNIRTDFAFFLGYFIIATEMPHFNDILTRDERECLINASAVFMQGVLKKMAEKIKDSLL